MRETEEAMSATRKGTTKSDALSLLCYIAADNDLSPYGMRDIEEISANGRPEGVHIGVEMDNRGSLGSIRYEITPPDKSNGNKGYRTVIERLPEQDSGSFVTLRNFIDWGARRSNAPHHIVVVWGHGMGNAVAPDFQSMGSALDIPKLVDAFQQAGFYRRNGIQEPNWSDRKLGRIAILGFDACNMASIENIWQLRDTAQMIVASQEKVPATGWPYASLVSACEMLSKKVGKSGGEVSESVLQDVGREIIGNYITSYKQLGFTALTLSSIIPSKLKGLVRAINDFGAALADDLRNKRSADLVRSSIADAVLYGQRFHLGDSIDIGHFARLIAGDNRITGTDTSKLARKVARNIKDNKGLISAVGTIKDRPNLEVNESTGLSIWLPAQRPLYLTNRNQYARDAGSEFSGWCAFLDEYYR